MTDRPTFEEYRGWSGLCPSGTHGLDFRGQRCDLCPSDSIDPVTPDESELFRLRREVEGLKEALEQAAQDLAAAAICVESGGGGAITDTVWLKPDPSLGPTLYEHLFAAAIRARGAK